MSNEIPEAEHDADWYASRAYMRSRPAEDRQTHRTKDEKEQDVMRVVAAIMGAKGEHCPGSGNHDFELHYPENRTAWGEELLWGATHDQVSGNKKQAAASREGPHNGDTAPTYVGEEWDPDFDLQVMLRDRAVQEHINKVCRYRTEYGIQESHLVIRTYSPLTFWRAIRPAPEIKPPQPIRSRLPVADITHVWVMTDFFEWVIHLTDGVWNMEPMPYLFPKFNYHYTGPRRPPGWPEFTPGSSWLPPL